MEIEIKYNENNRLIVEHINLINKHFIKDCIYSLKNGTINYNNVICKLEKCDVICSIKNSDINLYIIDKLLNTKLVMVSIIEDKYNYYDLFGSEITDMNIINDIEFNIRFDFIRCVEDTNKSRKLKLNKILK